MAEMKVWIARAAMVLVAAVMAWATLSSARQQGIVGADRPLDEAVTGTVTQTWWQRDQDNERIFNAFVSYDHPTAGVQQMQLSANHGSNEGTPDWTEGQRIPLRVWPAHPEWTTTFDAPRGTGTFAIQLLLILGFGLATLWGLKGPAALAGAKEKAPATVDPAVMERIRADRERARSGHDE